MPRVGLASCSLKWIASACLECIHHLKRHSHDFVLSSPFASTLTLLTTLTHLLRLHSPVLPAHLPSSQSLPTCASRLIRFFASLSLRLPTSHSSPYAIHISFSSIPGLRSAGGRSHTQPPNSPWCAESEKPSASSSVAPMPVISNSTPVIRRSVTHSRGSRSRAHFGPSQAQPHGGCTSPKKRVP